MCLKPIFKNPLFGILISLDLSRQFNEPISSRRSSAKKHIIYCFKHIIWNIRIKNLRSGIDDSHILALAYRMIEKDSVHRLANIVVPTKREREIADST